MNVNISSSRLNCDNVARFFFDKFVQCNVIPNKSVILSQDGKTCFFETGCEIRFDKYDKNFIKKTWPELKKKFDLNCAHININYDGCINHLIEK